MRILHVCDSIIGGTGTYLAELLPPQVDRYGTGNVALLLPEQHREHVEPRIHAANIELIYFPRRGRLSGMAALAKRYGRVRRDYSPDIVHAHSFGAGVITRIAGQRRQQPLIFCPHGWATDMEAPRPMIAAITLLERFLSYRANRIVLISEYEEKRAREMGIDPTKLVTVANGIAEEVPSVLPSVWEDRRLKLLFVGRIDRQKGLDVLLHAIEPLADKISLRVVGANILSGPVHVQADCSSVTYCGWRDRNGVAAEMMACDALVVPSRWEGFGLVAIEAMRLGVPVVGSDVGGLGETLGHGRYGVAVPPDDPIGLRVALESIDPDRLRALGKAGRERFLSNYTAGRMVNQIHAVYIDTLTSTLNVSGASG